jgi:hypothetical protein
VDAGSVLGLSAVRPALLDDLPAARPAEAESRCGADDMSSYDRVHDYSEKTHAWFADDEDDEDEDLDDEFGDENDEEDDEDEDENSEDPETWQVFGGTRFGLKTAGPSLDFRSGTCLDWRPLSSSSELDPFGGLRVCLPAQSLGS